MKRIALFLALSFAVVACGGTSDGASEVGVTTSVAPSISVPDDAAADGQIESTAGVLLAPVEVVIEGLPASTGQEIEVDLAPVVEVTGGGPTDADVAAVPEIAERAIEDVGAFWATHWMSQYPTILDNPPPEDFRPYDSAAGEVPKTTCATGSTDAEAWAENAFYCYGDSVIVYDTVLVAEELAKSGELGVVAMFAHEWGHHVQSLLRTQMGAADHPTFPIERELQADCFAGVYVQGAGLSDGSPVIPSDVAAAAKNFYLGERPATYGWFEPTYHGSPEERVEAFLIGYDSGEARTCDQYATYMDEYTTGAGPYVVARQPGTRVDIGSDWAFEFLGGPYDTIKVRGSSYQYTADSDGEAVVEVLAKWAPDPTRADGTALVPVGPVKDLTPTIANEWHIWGETFGYSYGRTDPAGKESHGFVIVNLAPTGDALVLDISEPGAPPSEEVQWAGIWKQAETALRSFRSPGIVQ